MTNLMSTLLMSILLLQMCCIFASPDFIGNQLEDSEFVKNIIVHQADVSSAGFLNFITSIPIYLWGSLDHIIVSITNLSGKSAAKRGMSYRKLKAAAAMALSLGLETSILPQRKRKDKTNKELPNADRINSPNNPAPPETSIDSRKVSDKSRMVMIASETIIPVPRISQKESEGVLMGVDENGLPVVMKSQHDYAKEIDGARQPAVVDSNSAEKGRIVKIGQSDKSSSQSIAGSKTSEPTEIAPIQEERNIDADNIDLNEDLDMDNSLFFMYDLDESFWWRWPSPDTDCSQNGYMTHSHAELSGMGPPVLPDQGLFLTWHFSLFSSLFNRMKRSKRRTLDPSKASLFIIPYDLGLDGYLDSSTCRNTRKCTKGHPEKIQSHVRNMPYYSRYQGRDHVLLWSLGQYHPWPVNGCDLLMKNFCEKCTITCYWMDPTKENNRFVSIPFPSGYHWWDGIKDVPWELGSDSSPNSNKRNMTAVYLGSTQTLNPAHTKIRRAMTSQCNASSECHWKQIAHSSTDTNIADLLSIYRKSVFCLCPPGDDPARKAVFDSILSGCIPVIFEVATLYNQYPWHLGEEASLDISVSIPGGLIRSGKLNLMTVLLGISKETIRLKQAAIAKYAPTLQYAMPPLELLKNKSDITPWDPPIRDGVDLTLDGMFVRAYNTVRNRSTGIPHRLMTSREWSREYDVVKIKIPGVPLGEGHGPGGQGFGPGPASGGKGPNNPNHRGKSVKRHNSKINGDVDGYSNNSSNAVMGDSAAIHHESSTKNGHKKGQKKKHTHSDTASSI